MVSIGNEFRRLRSQIVPKEVSVQEGAGIIEVNRTSHTHIGTLPHERKELGDRRRLDLRILVQKEDEVGASAQSVVDSNVVGPAESKVASILYKMHAVYRSRNQNAVIMRGVINDNDADRMLTTA
jgi:hypothetical protein